MATEKELNLRKFGRWKFRKEGPVVTVYYWRDGWEELGSAFIGRRKPSAKRWYRWAGWNCGE